MAAARHRRIVLFPYGQPAKPEHRDRCSEFYLSIGGDVSRVIDGPFPNIDRFIAYVRRIETVAEGLERPIVLLTATNPLALTVVAARRKIELAIPFMRQGTWVLFVDLDSDPFFTQTARSLGSFSYGPEGLTWFGPESDPFLIAMPVGCAIPDMPARSDQSAASSSPPRSTPLADPVVTAPPRSMERMRTRPVPPDQLPLDRARTGTDQATIPPRGDRGRR